MPERRVPKRRDRTTALTCAGEPCRERFRKRATDGRPLSARGPETGKRAPESGAWPPTAESPLSKTRSLPERGCRIRQIKKDPVRASDERPMRSARGRREREVLVVLHLSAVQLDPMRSQWHVDSPRSLPGRILLARPASNRLLPANSSASATTSRINRTLMKSPRGGAYLEATSSKCSRSGFCPTGPKPLASATLCSTVPANEIGMGISAKANARSGIDSESTLDSTWW